MIVGMQVVVGGFVACCVQYGAMSTGIVTQGVGYVRCWYGDVGMVGVGMVGVCMAGVLVQQVLLCEVLMGL